MEPQQPNWLKKKLTRSELRAITRAIRSGLPSQMPWTDIRIGLSPGRSSREEPHKPAASKGATYSAGFCNRGLWNFDFVR